MNQFVAGFAIGLGVAFSGMLVKDYIEWNRTLENKPRYWEERQAKKETSDSKDVMPDAGIKGIIVI